MVFTWTTFDSNKMELHCPTANEKVNLIHQLLRDLQVRAI